jgi:outer membrane protein TolC
MIIRALLLIAFVSIPAIAQQSSQSSKALTLQDCIQMAESAPSEVLIARQEREIADRDVVQARAGFLPQSQILSGFIYNSPSLNDPTTFSFLPLNAIREYLLLGEVRQEVDTSGRLRAEFARARANQDASRAVFEIARRDLRRAVSLAYYRLLLARRLAAVITDALAESRNFEQRTRLLVENGEAARADLVKASAQVASSQQALNTAETEATLANQELASFWKQDVNELLIIADVLDDPLPALEPDPAAGNPAPFLRRPEFNLFDANRRGFEADARVARSALLPQLSFVFQYGFDATSVSIRNRGYAAFINLSIPVFDWFKARSRAQQSKLRAQQMETRRAIAERQFSRDYQNAIARVKKLFEQTSLTREQVRLAEEDLRLSRIRYEGGEGSALDVVTAQNQLAQARSNYYTAMASYLNARADLEVASGR